MRNSDIKDSDRRNKIGVRNDLRDMCIYNLSAIHPVHQVISHYETVSRRPKAELAAVITNKSNKWSNDKQ